MQKNVVKYANARYVRRGNGYIISKYQFLVVHVFDIIFNSYHTITHDLYTLTTNCALLCLLFSLSTHSQWINSNYIV